MPRTLTPAEAEAAWIKELGIGADGRLLYGEGDEHDGSVAAGGAAVVEEESGTGLGGRPVLAEDRKYVGMISA